MLYEIALTPDALNRSLCGSPEVWRLVMGELGRFLQQDGLIRNLRNGDWLQSMSAGELDPLAREILELAKKEGRLTRATPQLKTVPGNAEEWCWEAEASRAVTPLAGIVVGQQAMEGRDESQGLTLIERLTGANWWRERRGSVRLFRSGLEYQRVLGPLMRHSGRLMFIDPYIDPSVARYRALIDLVLMAFRPDGCPPVIELHRAASVGGGKDILSRKSVESMFEPLTKALMKAQMKVSLYVWHEFHDRYLISNLAGLTIPNGFDTDEKKGALKTTFSFISTADRVDVERDFDPNSGKHHLHFGGPISLG